MNNSCVNVEKVCRKFIDEDDTSVDMIKNLKKLKSLNSNVRDRLAKVIKDLNIVRNIFKSHEQLQKASNRPTLKKGASYFEKICTFDLEQVEQCMKEEIQAFESEIEEARKGREQGRRERLAEIFMKIEGGAIFKIAALKNAEAEAKAEAIKKAREDRAQAAKSLRKIKQFGWPHSNGATF